MIRLYGNATGSLIFSHESMGELYYTFELETKRISGVSDIANIVVKEEFASESGLFSLREGDDIGIMGNLRSYNNKSGEGAKLVITVYAKKIYSAGESENLTLLTGIVCREPILRTTPLGRDICDMILAVSRRCGKSDYLPCVLWGSMAKMFSTARVGEEIRVSGRLQSRSYIKRTETDEVEKTAFEVSVFDAEYTGEQDSVCGGAARLGAVGQLEIRN